MHQPVNDLLGAHVSIAGGIENAPARAAAIFTRWTQIFTKAPQQWAERLFGEAEHDAYRAACDEHGIVGTTVHASYLINAASPNEQLYERSVRSLAAEYARCVAIGADHLVVHPGSATDGDREAGLIRNADAVARVVGEIRGDTMLCLEGTTGKGKVLGSTLEELVTLLARIEHHDPSLAARVGICLDTCHLYAAGYDLVEDYDAVMTQVDNTIGHDRVKVWHLNDSEGELGSTTDRHAWIGEGHIGMLGFSHLLRDSRYQNVPMLLETPKRDDPVASDARNLEVLRSLRA